MRDSWQLLEAGDHGLQVERGIQLERTSEGDQSIAGTLICQLSYNEEERGRNNVL